ncbi:MAG: universal stress protein [Acidimicrobiales bacterium]
MYTKIIVPFDGSDFSARSIPVGQEVARATNAVLRIVAFGTTASHADSLSLATRSEAERITDVDVEWFADRVGSVVEAIRNELTKEPGALICMSSVGRSHVAPALGSVADGVLEETFGPLLLVGPDVTVDQFSLSGPMLVCTDGSDAANAILPIATQWAITLPVQPWVINVVDPDALRDPGDLARVDHHVNFARRVAHMMQHDVATTVQYEVLHSNHPARTIVEYATDNTASVIAMATHGASGLRRFALGSTTMSVVHHAPCPVLVDRSPQLPTDSP